MNPRDRYELIHDFYRRHRRALITLMRFSGVDSFTLSAALMRYLVFRKH